MNFIFFIHHSFKKIHQIPTYKLIKAKIKHGATQTGLFTPAYNTHVQENVTLSDFQIVGKWDFQNKLLKQFL